MSEARSAESWHIEPYDPDVDDPPDPGEHDCFGQDDGGEDDDAADGGDDDGT